MYEIDLSDVPKQFLIKL